MADSPKNPSKDQNRKLFWGMLGLGLIALIAIGLLYSLPLFDLLIAISLLIVASFLIRFLIFSPISENPEQREDSETINTDLDATARLADSFNEAILTVSPRQKIIYLNKSARSLFPKAQMGQSLNSVLRHPGVKDLVDNVIEGRPAEPIIFSLQTPVEQYYRITASSIDGPIPGDPTRRSRVILVLYNVTDIERANTLRADFLANASHELKTPIASLLGYIETLRGHAKDDPQARDQFLGIMQQQAERMQRLISDLLSLRRIEQTEHIAPMETSDIYLAARAAKEAVAPMAENRKVKTKYSGPKSLPVIGAQDELVQLILNIVDNAVQMSPPGSKVLIEGSILSNWQPGDGFASDQLGPDSARRRIIEPPATGKDYAILRIRDSGPGFAREHLPRLTERFYRIAGDRSSREKGTGLGLAIVKHIILRHRGGLLIETAEGVGTEFVLLLPVAPRQTNETSQASKINT